MNTNQVILSIKQFKTIKTFLLNSITIINSKRRITKDYKILIYTINSIIQRSKISLLEQIISSIDYKLLMSKIENIINLTKDISLPISLKSILIKKPYWYYSKNYDIRYELYTIISKLGCMTISDCLLFFTNSEQFHTQCEHTSNTFNILSKYYNPITIDFYEKQNGQYILLHQSKKTDKQQILQASQTLLDQIDKKTIIISKNSSSSKSFVLKLNGLKVILPWKNYIFYISGYFTISEPILLSIYPNISERYNKLKLIPSIGEIPEPFWSNYLESITIREYLIYSDSELIANFQSMFNDYNKYKIKNVSSIVKEFIQLDLDKQRQFIVTLFLDPENQDVVFLGHLLLDLLNGDTPELNISNQYLTIYKSLPWSIQKKIIDTGKLIENNFEKLKNFNTDNISYEKRIQLLKTPDYVKSKALEKLKELNSKNGDTNSKAQQYLDGLLRIPFGTYMEEGIRTKIIELDSKIKRLCFDMNKDCKYIEETYKLCTWELLRLSEIREIIQIYNKSPNTILSIDKFIKQINNWLINLKKPRKLIDFHPLFNKVVSEMSSIDIKLLAKYFKITGLTRKQIDLEEEIKKAEISDSNFSKLLTSEFMTPYLDNNPDLTNFNYFFEITRFSNFNTNIELINGVWSKFNEYKSKYFSDLNETLDNAIFGLPQAKKQILRLLAQWFNGKNQGYVFGFEGPAGTGKTTLAKKGIAKCLKDSEGKERPFIFIPLGGSSNGSTLEGHNYTYVGSMWGRIVDGLMEAQCMNPIIYIDELDKISKTEQGREIVGILTHLTDPSQNEEFIDKYFNGIKIDLSKCLIIFSYNDPELVDKILIDRIQRIHIDPLTKHDKIVVAKKHLLPEILENIGISMSDIELDDELLVYIIDNFTIEAGARKLKELLYELYREINYKYLNNDILLPFKITKEFINECYKYHSKIEQTMVREKPMIGIINGLYASTVGMGGITIIEVSKYYSKTPFELYLTGSQGDVMKESMNVAKNLAIKLLGEIDKTKLETCINSPFGIHIHCPSGATPKDGPSAGTAITMAILSLLMEKEISNEIAITGEIDLSGNVLAIGGLEHKIIGGRNAGVKKILCPSKNKDDLDKFYMKYPSYKVEYDIRMIETVEDAMKEVFN
jgi:ATP-dependent Lon protease